MAGTANCYPEGRLATKWYPHVTDSHITRTGNAKVCEKDHTLPMPTAYLNYFQSFIKLEVTEYLLKTKLLA